MTSPTISVCLLTYNHDNAVRGAIESILNQDFQDFELIISDDCSVDGTWEIVQRAAREDARIKALRPSRNLGMAGNANFAVSHSNAPYVAILHHDDLYASNLLCKWLGVMQRHPDAGFVFSAFRSRDTELLTRYDLAECTNGREFLEHSLLHSWGSPVRGTAMVRRSAWDAVGGIREQFGMLADVDLWMRIAGSWAVGYVDEPLIYVRKYERDDYPKSYSARALTWQRANLMYAIHEANWHAFYGDEDLRGRLHQLLLRARVSAHAGKWLGYALVRQRREMLESAAEGRNKIEFAPLGAIRMLLSRLYASP